MSNIDKQVLIAKIKKQTESFDTVVLHEDEANALLDELESMGVQIANLTAERDALREGEMGDAKHSNTRAAADIYFQLVEECEIPAGGSLVEYVSELRERAAMLQGADGKPELTVWYGAMPETNGKNNWTAMLHRKCHHPWEGITIDRSEYPDRVRYEADRMRHLIGELADEPDIMAYDAEAHSGYVYPGNSPVIADGWVLVPVEPTYQMCEAMGLSWESPRFPDRYKAMISAVKQ